MTKLTNEEANSVAAIIDVLSNARDINDVINTIANARNMNILIHAGSGLESCLIILLQRRPCNQATFKT
ncbi:MAG: hypothetical protein HQL45_08515 [Alphaproteobacteria bacterium]|nr:hypothetical protein [Alphaproteobacteria bacterium]